MKKHIFFSLVLFFAAQNVFANDVDLCIDGTEDACKKGGGTTGSAATGTATTVDGCIDGTEAACSIGTGSTGSRTDVGGTGGTVGSVGTSLPMPSGSTTEGGSGVSGSGSGGTRSGITSSFPTRTGPIIPPSSELGGLPDTPITTLIKNVMGWLLYIFGFIAIIAFVISGLQYLTSAGDEAKAKTAKATMKYAAMGVLVALSALIVIRAIERMLRASLIF